jgi:5-methylcytosine-specific restriction endonuclease McrA
MAGPKNSINFNYRTMYCIMQLPCYYCGSAPWRVFNGAKYKKDRSQYAKDNGDFIYNGLDRIDSSLGHTYNNIVPCCYNCNSSKSNHTLIEFLEWIDRLRSKWSDRTITRETIYTNIDTTVSA